MPIRLAFVTQFPIELGRPHGGVEAVSVNLVPALAAYSEFELHVITLCPDTKLESIEKLENITIHRIPKPSGSELINALTTGKRLIEHKIREISPDLIHAHDTYGIMVKDLSIPKVFTIHGFIYGDTLLANGKFKAIRSRIWEFIEKSSWRKQPNIISISPYVRERLTGVTKAHIFDIDNPISGIFFDLTKQLNKKIIFTSAVITPRKNVLQLVKALKILADKGIEVELRIAGGITDQAYADQLTQFIETNNLQKNVTLLGRIPTAQVQAELCNATLYALVSLEENSPMGIEEAMAVGVPVVTSNRCGMPYMVKNGETGYLINPFDEHNIANKCELILNDPELANKMQCKAKQLARELYHVEKVAERTIAVYHEVLM
ncbi:glycosyltransferase family 4 protein [Psychromonas sp. 14N.309.X.WAT.B.A12]|jgi:glycosyltransferase involved in cell wall biosynthesis|uniref:glycosyltransferase family 4 protein n=1 Tax=unclassified Psychromonas TaxID=2614957 RepID=UPI0025AEDFA1|nr:glycosyltransferase family 4 protein [Psychromonas sp. 14N.309.X.WAT.B.A12]MDN2662798.1 glycosyltransferase family 4 protein [Psychromonas sp. 14N.309.X.WAT.B.A12]